MLKTLNLLCDKYELNKYDVKIISQRWGSTAFGFIDNNPEWEFLRSYVLWNLPPG